MLTQLNIQGLNQNGLAGTGLTSNDIEPFSEVDRKGLNDREALDI